MPHAPFLPKQQPDCYVTYDNGTTPGTDPSCTRLCAPPPLAQSSDDSFLIGSHPVALGASPLMQQPTNPIAHHGAKDGIAMQSLGCSVHASGLQDCSLGQVAHQVMNGSRSMSSLPPSAPHPYAMRPPVPPPPRPPPRPPNYPFTVRPPPRPPPRVSTTFVGESQYQHFGPGMQNHYVPVPPRSSTGSGFRVPPPPVLDLTTQGPEYEIGKDEEEVLMKSPNIQQASSHFDCFDDYLACRRISPYHSKRTFFS